MAAFLLRWASLKSASACLRRSRAVAAAGKAQRAGAPTSGWTQSTISNTHPDDALSIADHYSAAYLS